MLTLILQSLWSDFKKSWLNFSTLFALWTICYFTFGFSAPSASIGLGLAFVLLLSTKLPVRFLKSLSFCPVDTKKKQQLLWLYLWTKIFICLLLILLMIIAACLNHTTPPLIHLTEEWEQHGTFHGILNFDFLNFIWMMLLVAEFAIFKYTSLETIVWLLIMVGNLLATAYCIHMFLNKILSYETCFELQDLNERRPDPH